MKIRVCIPFYSEFETTKLGLQELVNCKEHDFVIEPRQGVYIGNTRNHLINNGVSEEKYQKPVDGFDAFLTIDSDIGFTLDNILKLINHNVDIVGSPYLIHGSDTIYECGRFSEIMGNIDRKCNISEKGLQPVHWMGSGMMLIKRNVFEKIEYPWYRHFMIQAGNRQKEAGEDISFCMGASNAGFKIWCDFDNPVNHKKRNQDSFDWNIHNIKKEIQVENQQKQRPGTQLKEELSSVALAANEIVTGMAKEYLRAVQEVKLCHVLIGNLNTKITELEKADSKKKEQAKSPGSDNKSEVVK